jgi:hypothetical protein
LCSKHKQIIFFEIALEMRYKCNYTARNTQQAGMFFNVVILNQRGGKRYFLTN